MPLTHEERNRLSALELPSDAVVREHLERWQAQTGWTDADIAAATSKANGGSYSRVAIQLFRHGRYPDAGNPAATMAIREAIIAVMDANPSILERRLRGETYRTQSYMKVRRAFFKALDRGWAYCIDGAPGSQKTRSLLALCAELEATEVTKNGNGRRIVYVRCRPRMSRSDILAEIGQASGLVHRQYVRQMLLKIRHHFATRRVLLVLDEAQHLDDCGIETLRELLDEPPYFGLIFAGSHDLRRKFTELNLEQWRSRLQNIITLEGLRETELREIWTKEVGALSDKQAAALVKGCTVADYRKNGETYLSARSLFFFIEQAKSQE